MHTRNQQATDMTTGAVQSATLLLIVANYGLSCGANLPNVVSLAEFVPGYTVDLALAWSFGPLFNALCAAAALRFVSAVVNVLVPSSRTQHQTRPGPHTQQPAPLQ